MRFDLHVHTNYSDGLLSPREVIDLAVKRKLVGIAITDHDTILALDEAIEYSKSLAEFYTIPGIEFGCVYNDEEVHILGYFIDYRNMELLELSRALRDSRVSRGLKIISKLNQLGLNISMEDVQKFSGEDYIGRPHIGRALIEKNYVNDLQQAFNLYLNRGKPGYVERYKLSIEEAIGIIVKTGGIPILAHPGLLRDKTIINYVISKGIKGLECIHSKHSNDDTFNLIKIAKKYKLIVTGGSDFHGDNLILGDFFVNLDQIPEMKERIYHV